MLQGVNERLLPFTGGQPLAGQIRSRRICHSLAVALHLEIQWVYNKTIFNPSQKTPKQ
ncbi:hypothetical protein [Xenorhabdus sp. Sc-CR9]|uniref:hypothetical protein n=1 Tax=Xenorhabdus sp. Sc-CR9 TaxID=2584468 RepID=UPI001F159021|nr:hypothetical protein [Xenorhabdus sp. Sc-CR9]